MRKGVVFIDSEDMDRCFWIIGDDHRPEAAGHSASISSLPRRLLDQEQIILILRGDKAATRRLHLPIRGERALSEAARLDFEDILADSVDDYSFGFSPLREGGNRLVTAFPRAELSEILSQCSGVGIDPDFVCVDHATLVQPEALNVLCYDQDRIIAQFGEGGLSGDSELYGELVGELLTSGDGVLVATTDPHFEMEETQKIDDDLSRAAFILSSLAFVDPPNLRRGIFAKQRNWLADIKRWRGAGYLMAGCLALWLLNMGVDAVKHRSAADRLYTEATGTFQSAFPGTPIRDLKRQARSRQGASSKSTFLALSVTLTHTLEQFDRLTLANLRYTEQGELVADLRFPDATSLELLKTALVEAGVSVREDGNLRRDENGDFAGQLYLEMRG